MPWAGVLHGVLVRDLPQRILGVSHVCIDACCSRAVSRGCGGRLGLREVHGGDARVVGHALRVLAGGCSSDPADQTLLLADPAHSDAEFCPCAHDRARLAAHVLDPFCWGLLHARGSLDQHVRAAPICAALVAAANPVRQGELRQDLDHAVFQRGDKPPDLCFETHHRLYRARARSTTLQSHQHQLHLGRPRATPPSLSTRGAGRRRPHRRPGA
mmetsp:Transcript_37561/g.77094  ORF Transcript_37561/g.77094 Transcript_37561/m.77094 type:complete len:214 (-) Transcript_37561:1401-2042(-)